MPAPVIPIIASGVALLGAGALITVSLLPAAPPPTARVWIDAPVAGAVVPSGDIPLDLHGTGTGSVAQLRVQIARDGVDVASLTVQDLARSDTASVLADGEIVWDHPDPGSYAITPYSLSDGQWVAGEAMPVTVVESPGAPVPDSPATSEPGEPTPTPTASETPTPTEEPDPAEPAPPAGPGSDPAPPAPAPSGTLTRTGEADESQSDFTVVYAPPAAFVDIQLQKVAPGTPRNDADSAWTSYGCSTGLPVSGGTRCTTNDVYVWGTSSGTWVYARAKIVANGQTLYVYLDQVWKVPATIS